MGNHLDKRGEVCVPTFTTDCVKEDVSNGVLVQHRENCYSVTKTVCTEGHDIEDMEVCATRLNLISLEAEAKVVTLLFNYCIWGDDAVNCSVTLGVNARQWY